MKNKNILLLYKKLGHTPLESILEFKEKNPEYRDLPMTYAGRLDPLAEGLLLCLVGDECKKKDKYLALNKEYVFEILIGFFTDTHDLLGLVRKDNLSIKERGLASLDTLLKMFVGKRLQTYPAYSSKTVGGKALHTLSRVGILENNDLPNREVEIFELENLGIRSLAKDQLLKEIMGKIDLVKGDFRQKEIKEVWEDSLNRSKDKDFAILKVKMSCSSGTYVRALVRDMSEAIKIPMCVYSIIRTKVGDFMGITCLRPDLG